MKKYCKDCFYFQMGECEYFEVLELTHDRITNIKKSIYALTNDIYERDYTKHIEEFLMRVKRRYKIGNVLMFLIRINMIMFNDFKKTKKAYEFFNRHNNCPYYEKRKRK